VSRHSPPAGGAHPDLATHDALGLATDAALAALDYTLIVTLYGNTLTVTNVPAALTEISPGGGVPRWRTRVDLSTFVDARATVYNQVAATAGTGLRIQYSTDESTWAYLDGAAGPEALIDGTGTRVSGWVALAAGAKADVYLRAATIGGDAIADPQLGLITVQFRGAL